LNPFGSQGSVVVTHENVHDDILLRTPFGTLQRIIRQIADTDSSTMSLLDPKPKDIFELLCDVSELAHESAATYLSITLASAASTQEVLSQHPVHYQRFYAMLANVIANISSASYVKYIIARELVDVIFAPPLLDALQGWLSGNEFVLREWQEPNFRLTELLKAIERDPVGYRDKLRQQVLSSVDAPSQAVLNACWDSEDWWEDQPLVRMEAMERAMFSGFCDVTINLARNLFPTVAWDQWEREYLTYVEAASRDRPDFSRPNDPTIQHRGVHVVRPMNYIMRNPEAPSPETLASTRELSQSDKVLVSDAHPTVLARYKLRRAQGKRDWIRAQRRAEGIVIERCSHELLTQQLTLMRRFALIGAPIFTVPPLVSSFDSAELDGLVEAYNDIVPMLAIELKDGILNIGLDSLFWYMHGDLSIWLDHLRSFGKSELIFTVPVEFQSLTKRMFQETGHDSEISNDKLPSSYRSAITSEGFDRVPSVFFIRAASVCGYFIRFVPFWLWGEILLSIKANFSYITIRDWKGADEKQREHIISTASVLPKIIPNLWPEC
jgi:hypothetical protein